MVSRYEVRDGQLYGRPAKRIDVRCAHGGSTFLLLPGDEPGVNAAAIDLLTSAHGIRRSCHCAELPAGDAPAPSRRTVTRRTRPALADAQS